MKRIFAAITLVIYLAFSSGIIINSHYCMNELASVRLYESHDNICGKCGMTNESLGCCRDEVIVIKLTDDQQVSSSFSGLQAPILDIVLPDFIIEEPIFTFSFTQDWQNHSPPLLSLQDTYLLNRNLRI